MEDRRSDPDGIAARPPDPFVSQRRPDPETAPEPTLTISGLLGDSDRPGRRRLYFNTRLDYYVEFQIADVIAVEDVPPDRPPFPGLDATRVVVRRDARLDYVYSRVAGVLNEFDLDIRRAARFSAGDLRFGPPQVLPPFDRSFFVCPWSANTVCNAATCTDPLTDVVTVEGTCGGTCNDTCGGTCGDSCFGTCDGATCRGTCAGATCQNTCFGTCGEATCFGTCGRQTCGTCGRQTCGGETCDRHTCATCGGATCDRQTCFGTCGEATCLGTCGEATCEGATCVGTCGGLTCEGTCQGLTCEGTCNVSCPDSTCGQTCGFVCERPAFISRQC